MIIIPVFVPTTITREFLIWSLTELRHYEKKKKRKGLILIIIIKIRLKNIIITYYISHGIIACPIKYWKMQYNKINRREIPRRRCTSDISIGLWLPHFHHREMHSWPRCRPEISTPYVECSRSSQSLYKLKTNYINYNDRYIYIYSKDMIYQDTKIHHTDHLRCSHATSP